jgi:hypothetical protein
VITPYAAAVAVCTSRVEETQKASPSVRGCAGSTLAANRVNPLRPWASRVSPSRYLSMSARSLRNQEKASRDCASSAAIAWVAST